MIWATRILAGFEVDPLFQRDHIEDGVRSLFACPLADTGAKGAALALVPAPIGIASVVWIGAPNMLTSTAAPIDAQRRQHGKLVPPHGLLDARP